MCVLVSKLQLTTQDWFETHKVEGIRVNILGVMNVIDVCHMKGIHCTTFGTGFMYTYDEKHPLGSGIGFTEQDAPNFQGPYYCQIRVMLEQLMLPYDNVLNLR